MVEWINGNGKIAGNVQVRYVRTAIFNYFNVYNVETGEMVNLKPEQFAELNIGGLDTKLGCSEIPFEVAEQLFEVQRSEVSGF